jgi:hypothetical protein
VTVGVTGRPYDVDSTATEHDAPPGRLQR